MPALELWLRDSLGVEIIVRDRFYDYAVGAQAGAPRATQVADRWHLLHNLREMLERWLGTVYATLRLLPIAPNLQGEIERKTVRRHRTSRPTRAAKEAAATNREKRLARFNEVKALYISGMPLLTISQKLGIDRKTVRAYAYAESFPERAPYPYVPNALTPYLDYLEKRHAEGCENASQLWQEIRAQGFKQTKWYVLTWMASRRREPSKHHPKHKKPQKTQASGKPGVHFTLPSGPQLAWLIVRDADALEDEETLVHRHLSQHRTFVFMQEHAKAFRKMVCRREAGELDAWLDTAVGSNMAQLKTFAEGLKRDHAEVRAALELPWSNGTDKLKGRSTSSNSLNGRCTEGRILTCYARGFCSPPDHELVGRAV